MGFRVVQARADASGVQGLLGGFRVGGREKAKMSSSTKHSGWDILHEPWSPAPPTPTPEQHLQSFGSLRLPVTDWVQGSVLKLRGNFNPRRRQPPLGSLILPFGVGTQRGVYDSLQGSISGLGGWGGGNSAGGRTGQSGRWCWQSGQPQPPSSSRDWRR